MDLGTEPEHEVCFRLLAEAARECTTFAVDAAGVITSWNAGAERSTGYAAKDVLGRPLDLMFRAVDVARGELAKALAAAARDGRHEAELWRVRKDGSATWAHTVVVAIRRGEALAGFGVLLRDALDQRTPTEQFRLAVEAAPTGMLMVNAAGQIVLANRSAAALFGYDDGELLGLSVEALVPARLRGGHPSTRTAFMVAPVARPMGGGRDLHGVRKDGSEVPIEIGLNPVRTAEGSFVLTSVVDITERKRAVEQFRLAIEAAPTGMLMVDRRGIIVLVNAQIEQLFGYAREELIGQPVERLVPARYRRNHPAEREGYFSAPAARPMGGERDLFGVRKDGSEVPIEIGLNPLKTPAGDFVLSSVVDITERKRRTGELKVALREREVLLQEVHHRVKNNLQIISSLINMQVRSAEPGSVDALIECQTRVQAIAFIHEQLFLSQDYARVPFSKYIRTLTNNVVVATGLATANVSVDLDVEDVDLAVDKAIPCGLFLNELITNAMKHGFKGREAGRITVELHRVEGDRCLLAVIDDGVGLPAGWSIDGGTSLGMQLISTLADQLEGELRVDGSAGTAFRLTFPLTSLE